MLGLIEFPNISPVLVSFEIAGRSFSIYWYAIAYIAGFLCSLYWMKALVRRTTLWPNTQAPISKEQLDDMLTWGIIGVIIGGRLGYVLFYEPAQFIAEPARILKVWEGGMAFHGGALGAVVAGWLFCRKYKLDPWSVGDLIASSVCFGLCFGRIANFINAELWGRPSDVPWAVAFPSQAAQDCGQATGEICGRHPSQLYEAGLEGIVLFAILTLLIFKFRWLMKPGRIIGAFALGYGLARMFVEGFRQADAQFITPENPLGHVIGSAEFGLTMGQTLSLPMVILGIGLIWYAGKRG